MSAALPTPALNLMPGEADVTVTMEDSGCVVVTSMLAPAAVASTASGDPGNAA
jgi:hypothetical protein